MSNKLPLPGSKPTGVTRHTTRRRNPWRREYGRWWVLLPVLGVLVAVVLLLSLWRATASRVTVVINGVPQTVRTHRLSVGGLLRALDVDSNAAAYLDPPADTRIERNMIISVVEPGPLTVWVDGEARVIEDGVSVDVAATLAAAGMTLGPGDHVEVLRAYQPSPREVADNPALAGVPAIPRELVVYRATQVIVTRGGETVSFSAAVPTLGEALYDAGYTIYHADLVEPPLTTRLDPAGGTVEVTITPAVPVILQSGGRAITLRTHADTVADLLIAEGLTLSALDYVQPAVTTRLDPGMTVSLVRVGERAEIGQTPIPYETVYVPDPALELDELRVVQTGQAGVRAYSEQVRYEDGLEVARWSAGEWVMTPPQAEVIAYGTRVVIRTLETPGGPVEYWRALRVLATSYSPSTAGHKQPGDPGFGIAAAGAEVVRGIVATDPRVIPLYTQMFIPGYGFGQALDTGGAIKGLRIDLGYSDAELVERYEFIDIYLLPPVPPPDQIPYVLPLSEAEE